MATLSEAQKLSLAHSWCPRGGWLPRPAPAHPTNVGVHLLALSPAGDAAVEASVRSLRSFVGWLVGWFTTFRTRRPPSLLYTRGRERKRGEREREWEVERERV